MSAAGGVFKPEFGDMLRDGTEGAVATIDTKSGLVEGSQEDEDGIKSPASETDMMTQTLAHV